MGPVGAGRGGVAAGRAAGAGVLDHAAQLHRPVRPGSAGPDSAHRHRRPDFIRAGRLRWHRRLQLGLADRAHRAVALADAVHRRGSDRRQRGGTGLADAAHVGPLPAAGHAGLGPVAVLPDGQPGGAGQVRRHSGCARPVAGGLAVGAGPRLLRADLGPGAAVLGGAAAPAGLARRARHARTQDRLADGRIHGRGHTQVQDRHLCAVGHAGQCVGLAVCALSARGEPLALQRARRHRIPVHGRAGRRGPCLGRHRRCQRHQADGRPVAGAAATPAGQQRQLRSPSCLACCWC